MGRVRVGMDDVASFQKHHVITLVNHVNLKLIAAEPSAPTALLEFIIGR